MKQRILETLGNSEDYVSGEKLSKLCGVSRTAIWKHINSLKEGGYNIDTQPRRGYRLMKRPDALLKTEILTDLNTKKWGKENLYTFTKIESTNLIAKKLANEGKPEGTVVVAEHQTSGKGRLGRKWESPEGKGIWVSLILRPSILPAKASQITFVLAVAMVKALEKIGNLKISIKWPNDILIDTRKVAGILTELSAEIERVNYLVVGIGVNVNQNFHEFPSEFRAKATSLKIATGQEISRVQVLKIMLKEIEYYYEYYLKKGFEEIIQLWKDNSITLGREVKVLTGQEKFVGIALDVDEDGCLLVRDKEKRIHKVIAGDVSVRRPDGSYA